MKNMKKIILVSSAFLFSVASFAQSDTTDRQLKMDTIKNQTRHDSHPDGVMMMNSKMMLVKSGEMTILEKEVTMTDGTKVMIDGTILRKDNTKMMLKEGQHIDMSGKITSMKKEGDSGKTKY